MCGWIYADLSLIDSGQRAPYANIETRVLSRRPDYVSNFVPESVGSHLAAI